VVAIPGAFDAAALDSTAFDVGCLTLENEPGLNILAVRKEAAAFVRSQLNPP
jgi:hypothetical protein